MGMPESPENTFAYLLESIKIPYEREYCFNSPHTKHRFDFALVGLKLAFEIDGGVWGKGRHQTPIGFMNDCKKQMLAVALGWRIVKIPSPWLTHTRRKKPKKYLISYEDLKEWVKVVYDHEKVKTD